MDIPILSYNMFMRPPLVQNGPLSSDYKNLRLRLFVEQCVPQYEILCLQELFNTCNSRPQALLRSFQAHHGSCYHHHLPSNLCNMRPIDSGLFIVSKWPIVERDQWIFTNALGADAFAAKGVLSALIEVKKKKKKTMKTKLKKDCGGGSADADDSGTAYVAIFCTHLQANYGDKVLLRDERDWNIYMRTQLKQLRELRVFVQRKMDHFRRHYGLQLHNAAFLAGDINVNARRAVNDGEDSVFYLEMMSILNSKQHEVAELSSPDGCWGNHLCTESHLYQQWNAYEHSKPQDVSCIRFVDLLREEMGGTHPVTFGAVEYDEEKKRFVPKETVLTNVVSRMEQTRLDYIFQIVATDGTVKQEHPLPSPSSDRTESPQATRGGGSGGSEESAEIAEFALLNTITGAHQDYSTHRSITWDQADGENHIVIRCSAHMTRVDEMFVKQKHPLKKPLPVTQLSDHYGVSTFVRFDTFLKHVDSEEISRQARIARDIIQQDTRRRGAQVVISTVAILLLLLFLVALVATIIVLANTYSDNGDSSNASSSSGSGSGNGSSSSSSSSSSSNTSALNEQPWRH